MFGELHHWLIVNSDEEFLQFVDDGSFGPSTDFVLTVSLKINEYKLYDVFNLLKDHHTKLNLTFFGIWSKDNGLIVNLTEPKIKRRSNMQGVELRASYFRVRLVML